MMKSKSFIIVASLLFVASAASLVAAQNLDKSADGGNDYGSITNYLDLYNSIVKELNMYYVDTIDAKKVATTSIDAMLYELDPYTEYIPKEEQGDFMTISTGEYGGIGSYIYKPKGRPTTISGPYEGSPAEKAGLKIGDEIIMIDGDTVSSWESDKVSNKLKGLVNTELTVTVRRPFSADSIHTFHIVREKIHVNTVPYYGMLTDSIGIIELSSFNEKSPVEVKEALLKLKENPKLSGLVLDLRGNGGGILESAVQIVGLFVDKGTEVLKTRGRVKQSEKSYKTTKLPVDTEIPLAVLIDGGSASASEITAGALQDLDRAVIIGNRSYGKGLVQSTRPLGDNGLLKLTISKYYIPSGRLIQAIDYSHRNIDGTASRIPDSLTTVFHTSNGREVRDGGGIKPDVEVEYPEVNRLIYNIIRDNWAFDYAVKFAAEHPSIAPAEEFEVSDEVFNDFKAFIDPKRFDYDKVCEKMLADLKKTAKVEGYLNDSTAATFEILENQLKHNLNQDLDTNKKRICDLLASEIVKHYYFSRGESIVSLKRDIIVDSIKASIGNPDRYAAILNKVPAKKQAKKQKTKK